MDNEQEAITGKWTSVDKSSRLTGREIRLIDNCRTYAANDPAGLPAHNLMVIVAKLANLLIGKELKERTLAWHISPNGVWSYDDLQAPTVIEIGGKCGKWHYAIPAHAKTGMAASLEDAKACVERAFAADVE